MALSRNYVVLLAHPDDEVFLLPFLEEFTRASVSVTIFYLTDGSGTRRQFDPTQRLEETQRFLTDIGVSATVISVGVAHYIRDTRLHESVPAVLAAIQQQLTGTESLIITPEFEGGHPDHDACHYIGALVSDLLQVPHYSFPLYRSAGRGLLFSVMSPFEGTEPAQHALVTPVVRSTRLNFARIPIFFPSQWKTWLALYPVIMLRIMTSSNLRLMHRDTVNYSERPNEGRVFYEERGWLSFEDWSAALLDDLRD